jgi:Domain of unknown function (DUF4157)
MADDTPKPEESEDERKRRTLKLSQDIANRYSPEKLSKIVVDQAGRGEHLDLATQSEMEGKIGGKFGGVRVFRGPFAESITKQHGADAVTVANAGMILVREGPRSDPKTALGKALIAHELTHVKQAQRGLHFALEGGQSSNAPHEAEAEHVEASVHAEASGAQKGGGKGGKKGEDPEEKKKKVMARVVELIDEWNRLHRERLGLD